MTASPRVPLHTVNDMFAKLQWEHDRLQGDWSEYNSFNFVVTAYHLYRDWIPSAGTRSQQQRRKDLPLIAKKLARVLGDITNASKHWRLHSDGEAVRIVDAVNPPMIGDWDAYFNTGPLLYIDVAGAMLSMSDLSRLTMHVMRWIIQGRSNRFPPGVKVQLQKAFAPL